MDRLWFWHLILWGVRQGSMLPLCQNSDKWPPSNKPAFSTNQTCHTMPSTHSSQIPLLIVLRYIDSMFTSYNNKNTPATIWHIIKSMVSSILGYESYAQLSYISKIWWIKKDKKYQFISLTGNMKMASNSLTR